MARLESLMGEMAQQPAEGRGMRHGVYHAGWNVTVVKVDQAPVAAVVARPLKKRGGCKTCDGRGCVGRCRF